MKKSSFRRFLALSIFGAAATALNTGCSINLNDIGFGFWAGLGAIPANLVGNFITGQFFGL